MNITPEQVEAALKIYLAAYTSHKGHHWDSRDAAIRAVLESIPPQPARLLLICDEMPEVADGFVRVTGFSQKGPWCIGTRGDAADSHYADLKLPIDSEREAFERAVRLVQPSANLARGSEGRYVMNDYHFAWSVWQMAKGIKP